MDKSTADKIRGMARRVVLKNINDDGETQTASVEIAPGIWRDKVEILQPYGLATSVPEDGALALAIAVGGNEDDLIIMPVANPSTRLGGLNAGETALYNRHGDGILIGDDGNINVKAGASVTFTVQGIKVVISGSGVDITGGNVTHNGKNIGATHVHIDVVPGGGLSGPPKE